MWCNTGGGVYEFVSCCNKGGKNATLRSINISSQKLKDHIFYAIRGFLLILSEIRKTRWGPDAIFVHKKNVSAR